MAHLSRNERILNLLEWWEWTENPAAEALRLAYTGPHIITCGDAFVLEHGETIYCCRVVNHSDNHRSPSGISWR